jgi:hypothetical protein
VQVVVNPTTIRSRPRRPLADFVYSIKALWISCSKILLFSFPMFWFWVNLMKLFQKWEVVLVKLDIYNLITLMACKYQGKIDRLMGRPTLSFQNLHLTWLDISKKNLKKTPTHIHLNLIEQFIRLTVMEYLCHKWPQICSTCRKHFPVLSSFMTYHRVYN